MTTSETTSEVVVNDSKIHLGFWIYVMTDCVLFASLFAAYAVLKGATAGGPGGGDIFDIHFVLIETLLLLTSSFTCGMALLAAQQKKASQVIIWLIVTATLGALFLGMELYEFTHLVNEGNGWQRSAFLSAFFTLVGTHGLHITAGLIWIFTMAYRVAHRGLTPRTLRNLMMLGVFWHFLDLIWIFIFTVVYMIGVL